MWGLYPSNNTIFDPPYFSLDTTFKYITLRYTIYDQYFNYIIYNIYISSDIKLFCDKSRGPVDIEMIFKNWLFHA